MDNGKIQDMSDTSTAPDTLAETPTRPKRFAVLTWGCQMNVDDSDQIENLLLEDGLIKADSLEDADVVMLNTCSVRQKPEDKVYSELGRIAELKATRPDMVIGVTGCMAQRAGAEIARRAPYVDVIVGTAQLERIPELVRTRKHMLDAGDATAGKSSEVLIHLQLPRKKE